MSFGKLGLIGGRRRVGDATALTPVTATSLFTTTRSGSQLHFPERNTIRPGGYAEIAADVPPLFPVLIAGNTYSAFLPQGAGTNLNTNSNRLDNAAYTKTGCTAEWIEDATSAFGGYSRVTATAANATVTRALTRASILRNSKLLASASGTVKLSQDDGTTQVTLAAGYDETDLVAVTSENPVLHIELAEIGDYVDVFDWVHQEPVAGTPLLRNFRPIAGTSETVGAASLTRTISPSPTALSVALLFQTPSALNRSVPGNDRHFFIAYEDTANFLDIVYLSSSDRLAIRKRIAGVTPTITISNPPLNTTYLVEVEPVGADYRARFNGGDWTTLSGDISADLNLLAFGRWGGSSANQPYAPLIAFRDNLGNLGVPRNGWNHSAITAFEGSL